MHEHDDERGAHKGSQRQEDDAVGFRACSLQKVTWLLLCGLLLLAATLTWVSPSGLDSLHLRAWNWSREQQPYKFGPMSYDRLRGELRGSIPAGTQGASSSSNSGRKPRCLAEAFADLGIQEGPWQDMSQSCLAHASGVESEPEFLSLLHKQSLALPPRSPALAAHDWEGQVSQLPQNWPAFSGPNCPVSNFMMGIKVYKGVLYSSPWPHDHPPSSQVFWTRYREIMYEMLVTVLWLYKDVPDMDLVVHIVDLPQHCNPGMPVLQFAIFNQTSAVNGERISVDPDAYVCWGGIASADAGCRGHTKGFTMPHPDAWSQLAMSRSQLWWYSYCLHTRYVTQKNVSATQCGVPRKPVAFWRGSATGSRHGWDPTYNSHFMAKTKTEGLQYLYSQLMNQRVSFALMADKYPWLDVGISTLHAEEFAGFSDNVAQNEVVSQLLGKLLKGDFLDMEQISQYHLSLSIDGHGPAFRLPRLFLANVPVVKVDSIQREWFIDRALPGVHYEVVRHDLSDVVERTRLLTQEAARDSSRLEAMALAATQLGVELFNGLAQVESVAWSLARMKEACAWEVRPPENAVTGAPANGTGEKGWHLVKLKRDRDWHAAFIKPIKEDIMKHLHHNFV